MLVAPTFTEIMEVAKSGGKLSEAPNLFPDFGWSLQDGTGGIAQAVNGYGNDGTLTNGPTWVDATRGGKALSLTAASLQYVILPTSLISKAAGTLSIWAKKSGVNIDSLFGANDGATVARVLLHSNGTWFVETDTDGDVVSSAYTQDTLWHHYVVVFLNSLCYLYQDAIPLNPAGGAITDDLTVNRLCRIGASYFTGEVADARIFPRALTASEVQRLYVNSWASYRLRSHVLAAVVAAGGGTILPQMIHQGLYAGAV